MIFRVIDPKTGNEPIFDGNHICKEKWFKESGLIPFDLDVFAITENGNLILIDDCNDIAYVPNGRFDVIVAEAKHGVWIPIKLGMPEENVPVNITWVNRNPVSYYSHIKDKPFTATGVYFYGKWYWFYANVTDMLAEYGKCAFDEIDDDIEVIAWMPLPEPYEAKEKENA